ncbi:hypothetical protein A6F68_00174 [Tsuneonella dongtanensis]|uniref:DUF2975 domain-containing protein n=1 Tax=Tsuneonella dongtanensis TaxID=692370 RepID=A0A1B2A975_9SPHN|nr:DUF2975 domain-containing protein [Tsuneonella dongtanensis]ANY18709.1 hypothetical protein A6F68_00174 [Tsuneonella dongtanensis]
MSLRPKDPLLTAARLVIGFFIAIGGLVIAAIVVGIPAMLLNQAWILAAVADEGVTAGPEIFGAIGITLVCIAAFIALAIWFLILLRRIVDTVGKGDPFVPENANRLARMGWIVVGTQVLSIPGGAMVLWLAEVFKEAENIHVNGDVGISGGAIVLILVLFILARVFRQGAAMREDLEGTV